MSSCLQVIGLKPKVMEPLEYGPYMAHTYESDTEYEMKLENQEDPKFVARPINLEEKHRLASKHLSLYNVELYDNGTFGSVYAANDKFGRAFAIKTINPKYNTAQYINKLYLPRVYREVYCLSNLRHENIVKFYKYRFVSMEYHTLIKMERLGPNLAILSNHQWTLPNVQKLAKQLASAIKYMHGKFIAHHDVKMENIMATKHVYEFATGARLHRQISKVDFKIGDFGSAHYYPRAPVELSYRSGTSHYKSPEKMFNEAYNPMAADHFAMGVCLLTAWVGGEAVREIIERPNKTDHSVFDLEGNPRMYNIATQLLNNNRAPDGVMDDRTAILRLLAPENERFTADDIIEWFN